MRVRYRGGVVVKALKEIEEDHRRKKDERALSRLQEIMEEYGNDPAASHKKSDYLLVELLRAEGYDRACNYYLNTLRWYE